MRKQNKEKIIINKKANKIKKREKNKDNKKQSEGKRQRN